MNPLKELYNEKGENKIKMTTSELGVREVVYGTWFTGPETTVFTRVLERKPKLQDWCEVLTF